MPVGSGRIRNREYDRRYAKDYRSRKPWYEVQWRLYGNPLKYKMQQYRANAKRRGMLWELSEIQASWLLMEPCFYCDKLQSPVGGIDRMDSRIGYEWSNVVPCCSSCNITKSSMVAAEFVAHATKISDNWDSKGAVAIRQ